jgi:CubicO group peptidase (beta-lactamase class C family)
MSAVAHDIESSAAAAAGMANQRAHEINNLIRTKEHFACGRVWLRMRMAPSVRPLAVIAVICLLAGFASATDAVPRITRLDGSTITGQQVDATVRPLLEAAHVTGAGIAIFQDRRIAYLKAYGLRDTEKQLPLTPDSVMTSASLSKAAFATVVMRLVQQRRLDLDKPVYQYLPKPLPEYPRYADLNGDERYRKITLRMLLSHTSGFPNWRAFEDDHKLKIHFEPGSRYAYSGEGIDLAQFVVETVTHEPLTTLMVRELFVPLGMTRTSMVWEPRFESDFANGYDEYGRSLGPEKRTQPDAAGSMQTTLRDYATFLSAVMSGKVLEAKTTAEMLRSQVAIHSAHQFPSLDTTTSAANDGIHLGYGLGWGVYASPYGRAFFKEGHDEGWRHVALCFDEKGTGILILTNSSNGEGIFKPVLDALLGPTHFPFEWELYTPYTELPPLPKLKQHTRVTLTAEQLKRFVGRYGLSPQVVLTVTAGDGRLFIQENDEPKQEYLAESEHDFYSTASSDEVTFSPADGSTAQVMILHLGDKDVPLKRLP